VRRYARRWSKERGQSTAAAYVPLSFAPGEAYQFDWRHEVVLLNGVTVIVKAAHVRLCHSRMLFVRCYPRETQEMVFDAHDRAFALFKGTCGRGIYDNMKTAVETIFVGKGRLYNRRFMQMCSHYLVDPVACTPASGWEKGQVENQVGLVRERFFTPRLRFKTLDELNASAPADVFRSSSNSGRWVGARKGVTRIDGVGAFDPFCCNQVEMSLVLQS
jgi:transposase